MENYLIKWAEKLSLPLNEIEKEYNKLVEEEKEIHKELDLDGQKQRALQRLALVYKKQLRSPAVGFEGIVIGTSDCVDIIARQRREAISLYKADPQTAIIEGVTDEEGTPLDTRKEWSTGRVNPNFGKPLPENNFIRNVYGIVVKSKTKDSSPRFFQISISGEKANNDIPTFKPIRFMAIDRTPQEVTNTFNLNASQFTTFVVDEQLILPPFKELISKYCSSMITDLKNLNQYHNSTKDNFNRLVIIEGDVSSLNLEPTAFGSRIMTIEDTNNSLDDLDAKGITCWIPDRSNIDFAEGSKVLVVGRTGQGKKKDENGNVTEELSDVTIGVFGLYALPEYKILLPNEIKEIAAEDLDIV